MLLFGLPCLVRPGVPAMHFPPKEQVLKKCGHHLDGRGFQVSQVGPILHKKFLDFWDAKGYGQTISLTWRSLLW